MAFARLSMAFFGHHKVMAELFCKVLGTLHFGMFGFRAWQSTKQMGSWNLYAWLITNMGSQ